MKFNNERVLVYSKYARFEASNLLPSTDYKLTVTSVPYDTSIIGTYRTIEGLYNKNQIHLVKKS